MFFEERKNWTSVLANRGVKLKGIRAQIKEDARRYV
jgi:hypothetical protein